MGLHQNKLYCQIANIYGKNLPIWQTIWNELIFLLHHKIQQRHPELFSRKYDLLNTTSFV